MTDCKKVYLHITTYVALISYAKHYYGRLRWEDGGKEMDVDVRHELTAAQAIQRRKEDRRLGRDCAGWKEGDSSSAFDCKETLINEAIKLFKLTFGDKKAVLLLGNMCIAEPMPILAGLCDETVARLNAIWQKCEDLGWWDDRNNDKEVMRLCKEWERTL